MRMLSASASMLPGVAPGLARSNRWPGLCDDTSGLSKDVAHGLAVRHDHGSQYMMRYQADVGS